MDRRKRHSISTQIKAKICKYKEDNPAVSQQDLADIIGFTCKQTVAGILKQPDKWIQPGQLPNQKKLRGGKFPELEDAVKQWILECRSKQITPLNSHIQDKARQLSNLLGINSPTAIKFTASNGWLEGFKRRHHIWAKQRGDPGPDTVRIHGQEDVKVEDEEEEENAPKPNENPSVTQISTPATMPVPNAMPDIEEIDVMSRDLLSNVSLQSDSTIVVHDASEVGNAEEDFGDGSVRSQKPSLLRVENVEWDTTTLSDDGSVAGV